LFVFLEKKVSLIKKLKLMQFLTLKIKENHYALFLQFLRTLSYVEVVKSNPSTPPNARYDFSDLTGKLEWQGDAVDEQRRLRDEW
jgi:hypothetical protein